MLKHRQFKNEDLKLICTFPKSEQEVFFISTNLTYPLAQKQFSDSIKSHKESTTFLFDDCPIGYADFYQYEGDDRLYIGNIMLDSSYRGRGYGKMIVKIMLEKLKKHKQKEALLCVSSNNINSILLYRSMCFIPYEVEKRLYYDKSSRCVIFMKKILDDF